MSSILEFSSIVNVGMVAAEPSLVMLPPKSEDRSPVLSNTYLPSDMQIVNKKLNYYYYFPQIINMQKTVNYVTK